VSPSFRDRGKLRRRLRYLRRVRELGYRDLGGLTFDLHRFRRDGAPLVQEKLAALSAVDAELRAVERALGEERAFVDLREAGIAACPRCAALHGSEARFCPSCGIALAGPMAGAVAAPPAGIAGPSAQHTPLWGPPASAAGERPAPEAAVFPGPVSPVPPEQPTQIIPAGADGPAPPVHGDAPVRPAPADGAARPGHADAAAGSAASVASGAPAPADAPAPRADDARAGAGERTGDGGRADAAAADRAHEPAAVAGGSVAAPDPRAPRP
jgi:hypothetical protein